MAELQNPFESQEDIGSLPMSTAATANDLSPLMGFPNQVLSSQAAEDEKRAAESRKQMDIADKASSGFWPTALAVTAAVTKADFRPLMQLQQAKQQTAFAKAVAPDMLKIERLTQAGKFEEAEMLISSLSAATGERAPQLAQFIQQRSKRIADLQTDVRDLKTDVFIMEGSGLANKDHPNHNFYTAMKKLAAQGTPYSAARAKEMIGKGTSITSQVVGERQTSTGGITNVLQTRSVPQVYTVQQLQEDPLAISVAGQFGLGLPEFASVLNRDRDVQTQGGVIKAGSPEADTIRDAYISKQPTRGDIALGRQIPDLNPDLMAQVSQLPGMTREKLLAKQWTPVELKAAQEMQTLLGADRVAYNEQAKILADLKTNPQAFKGQVVFNASPNADTFGVPVPLQTVEQVIAQQGRLGVVSDQVHTDVIAPGMQAVRTLTRIPELFQILGNPSTWNKRIPTGFERIIQDRLGVAIEPGQEMAKAAELFLRRAIEEAEKTGKVNEQAAGDLKKYLVGPFADKDGAIAAAAYIQQQILQRIYGVTNVRIPAPLIPSEAPITVQQVSPGVYSAPASSSGTPAYPPGYTPQKAPFVPESPYTTYKPGPLRQPLPQYTPPAPLPQQAPPQQAAPPSKDVPKAPTKWKAVPGSMKY